MKNIAEKYRIVLGSHSPRRKFLLKKIGLNFIVRTKKISESFPPKFKEKQIAIYLCKKKAKALKNTLQPNDLLITADTIVWLPLGTNRKGKLLSKPAGPAEAALMLKLLSGKMHRVFTAVSLTTLNRQKNFCKESKVFFKNLSEEEIDYYVQHYKPYDKAGAYGAQECLPEGMNPCSEEEKKFLLQIGKPRLYAQGNWNWKNRKRISIIKKISGSYFNVMGLPLKELYEKLKKF